MCVCVACAGKSWMLAGKVKEAESIEEENERGRERLMKIWREGERGEG